MSQLSVSTRFENLINQNKNRKLDILNYPSFDATIVYDAIVKGDIDIVKHGCEDRKVWVGVPMLSAALNNLHISCNQEMITYLYEQMMLQSYGQDMIAKKISNSHLQMLIHFKLFTDPTGMYCRRWIAQWRKHGYDRTDPILDRPKMAWPTIDVTNRGLVAKLASDFEEVDSYISRKIYDMLEQNPPVCPPDLKVVDLLAFFNEYGNREDQCRLEDWVKSYQTEMQRRHQWRDKTADDTHDNEDDTHDNEDDTHDNEDDTHDNEDDTHDNEDDTQK
jgi:hypothetical protein